MMAMSDWQALANQLGPQGGAYRFIAHPDNDDIAVRAVRCDRCGVLFEVLFDEDQPPHGWECEGCQFHRAMHIEDLPLNATEVRP